MSDDLEKRVAELEKELDRLHTWVSLHADYLSGEKTNVAGYMIRRAFTPLEVERFTEFLRWAMNDAPEPRTWQALVKEFTKRLSLRREEDLRALFIAHIADLGAGSRLFNLALTDE